MGWFTSLFSHHASAHDQVTNAPVGCHLSHAMVAAAAAYEAARSYQEHHDQNGKPESHAQAKRLLAGFAGGFVENLIERGFHYLDKEDIMETTEGHYKNHIAAEYPDGDPSDSE